MLPHERNNPLKYDLVKLSSSIIYSSGMLFLLRPTIFKNNDISYFNSIIYIYAYMRALQQKISRKKKARILK